MLLSLVGLFPLVARLPLLPVPCCRPPPFITCLFVVACPYCVPYICSCFPPDVASLVIAFPRMLPVSYCCLFPFVRLLVACRVANRCFRLSFISGSSSLLSPDVACHYCTPALVVACPLMCACPIPVC